MHHIRRCCIIDNVTVGKENTNETSEAIKNWSLTFWNAIASWATDTGLGGRYCYQYQDLSVPKEKVAEFKKKKKQPKSKYFLQIYTYASSTD